MTTIRKIFGSGQVTLPKAWRKKINTSTVQITQEGKKLIISPIEVDEYESIFRAKDFGYKDGVPVEDFLKALKEVNREK